MPLPAMQPTFRRLDSLKPEAHVQSEPLARTDQPGRLHYLDSLRGIAAVIVVLSHLALLVPEETRDAVGGLWISLQTWPALGVYLLEKLHVAARSGVLLFFILSGFVLTRSLTSSDTPYLAYLLKRLFRIYPALLVTVLFSYVSHLLIGSPNSVTSWWIRSFCDIDLSPTVLVKNLALWGTEGSNTLNAVIWSLVHEMRISVFFPPILWTVRRFRLGAVLAWLLVSVGCTLYMHARWGHFISGFAEDEEWLTWIGTLFFVPFFAAGAWLSLNADRVGAGLRQSPIWLVTLMAVGSAWCLVRSDAVGWSEGAADYLHGLGGFGLLILAVSLARFERALSVRPAIWTGRISYSLYLIHMPILFLVIELPPAMPPLPVVGAAVLLLALPAAEILTRTVELPFNRLGKRLAGRLDRRHAGELAQT